MNNYIEHYLGLTLHKIFVIYEMFKIIGKLFIRAFIHDYSKYGLYEASGFGKVTHKLKYTTYNSDYYKYLLEKIKPYIKHHYKINRHHPEHYQNGIDDMSIYDLLEMICDWKSSMRRHKDFENFDTNIGINKKRFDINEVLIKLIQNI